MSCRSPARESRWRTTSPEDTSIGAVPLNEANAAADRKRRNRADAGEDLPCVEGSDSAELCQRGAGFLDRGGDGAAGCGDAPVQATYLADQLGRHANPRSQLRRHVHGLYAIGAQTSSQWSA